MRNLKHSLVALIAIAMLSSLAATQASQISSDNERRLRNINTSVRTENITIAEKESDEGIAVVYETVSEETDESDEDSADEEEEDIAEKSFLTIAYVNLSGGTLPVRALPSDEAEVIDNLEKMTEVEILESTDGWYKISFSDMDGYVPADCISVDKSVAEESAMNYTHYKKAHIDINSSAVRVRTAASEESDIIEELDDNTSVVIMGQEDNFIKIAYGSDYREGYVIASAVEPDDKWVSMEAVSRIQQEAAEAKAAAAREAAEKAAAEKEAAEKEAAAAAAAEKEAAEKKASESASKNESSYSKTASAKEEKVESSSTSSASKGQAIVDTAMKYLGVKYVWGGTSPSGFDCSGLVQYVCRQNGISVSRTSSAQAKNGVAVSKSNLQPGDLVFFQSGGSIHHVGIYIGNGQMIHAPQTGDVVKISSINTAYRINGYACARRVY